MPRAILFLSGALIALPVSAAVQGTVLTVRQPSRGGRSRRARRTAAPFRITDAHAAFHFDELVPPVTLRVMHPRFQALEAECCAEVGFDSRSARQAGGVRRDRGHRQPRGMPASSRSPSPPARSPFMTVRRPRPAWSSSPRECRAWPRTARAGCSRPTRFAAPADSGCLTLVAGTRIVAERRAGATALANRSPPARRGERRSRALLVLLRLRGPRRRARGRAPAVRDHDRRARLGVPGRRQLPDGWPRARGLVAGSRPPRLERDGDAWTASTCPVSSSSTPATVGKHWTLSSGLEVDLLLAPSQGDDIGKPNQRYPARVTTYPEEQHLVGRVSIHRHGVWHLDLYAHPNTLDTENSRSTERSLVENEAIDFGFNLQRELTLPASFAARVGLDYFGRQGVQATETITDLTAGTTEEGDDVGWRRDRPRSLRLGTPELRGCRRRGWRAADLDRAGQHRRCDHGRHRGDRVPRSLDAGGKGRRAGG